MPFVLKLLLQDISKQFLFKIPGEKNFHFPSKCPVCGSPVVKDPDGPSNFSWWFYTPSDFKKNKGMRIDLVLVTEALGGRLVEVKVDKEERGKKAEEKPSDHAPVVASFSD